MITSAPNSTPFAFDTEFDATGQVVVQSSWQPTRRSYTPDEVEALLAQARAEVQAQVLAQAEAQQAQALAVIAESLANAGPRLAHAVQTHREQSVELALAMVRQLAGLALDRLPTGMLEAALDTLGHEIEASPRLLVRASSLDEASQDRVRQACADTGFTGPVTFRDDASLSAGAFDLEWSDGRAAFDLDEATGRLREALLSQLAAEAGHTEPTNLGAVSDGR